MKKRLTEISLLRIYAIFLIVLGHATHAFTIGSGWVYTSPVPSKLFSLLTYYIYSYHLPLLFFISGYLYMYLKNELGKYSEYEEYVKDKFKRLIIPYLFIGLFFMIPIKYLLGQYVPFDFKNIIIDGLFLSQSSGHLWFLVALFNIYIIYYWLDGYAKKIKPVFVITLFSGASLISDYFPQILQIRSTLYFFIFFILGYYFRKVIRNKKFKYPLFLSSTFFVLHFSLFYLLPRGFAYVGYIDKIIYLLLGVLGTLYSYFFFEWLSKKSILDKIKNLINYIDLRTMQIYLFHEEFVFIILYLLLGKVSSPILVLSAFSAAIIGPFLLIYLVSKNKTASSLIGLK